LPGCSFLADLIDGKLLGSRAGAGGRVPPLGIAHARVPFCQGAPEDRTLCGVIAGARHKVDSNPVCLAFRLDQLPWRIAVVSEDGTGKAAFVEELAMFQNIVRPFVEAGRFVRPCLEDAMSTDTHVDKFRGQFLKALAKSLAACRDDVSAPGPFNEAEAEVLYYLSQGHSNKEIARLIGMSPDTVKYRLKSLFRKIGVSKRRDAVRVSAERGLIPDVETAEMTESPSAN